jgi:hypothetical protein
MREYISLGNDMLQDFYKSWEERFAKFEDE